MPILLFLFAVGVVITVAGLLLSYLGHKRSEKDTLAYPPRPLKQRSSSYVYSGYRSRTGYITSAQLARQTQARTRALTPVGSNLVWSEILSSLNVGRLFGRPRAGEPTPWLGIALVLIATFGICLVMVHPFARGGAVLIGLNADLPAGTTPAAVTNSKTTQQLNLPMSGASKVLVRVNQLDVAQYASKAEYDTWAYSACSAASMTEVINSYESNHHRYRVTDILKVEAGLNQISPDLGLLSPSGIDKTVDKFGYKAIHLNNPSLDTILKIGNNGNPVIVDFPPDRWSGGHILIVRGGDSQYVYLADSSMLNMQAMKRDKFMQYWAGFAVLVLPK